MKRLLLILTLVCFVISGWADQITREQALRKAQQFLSQKGLPSSVKVAETQMSRRRAQGISQPDYYYVFNNGQNQGFVIISGDDRAETVLGYATSGSFDVDNIPCNMAAWLQGYADQIKYIQEHPAQSPQKPDFRRANPAISKLVTCQWDQGDPFNAECPTVGKKKCVTGCVTTAVSQILYYHAKINGYMPSCTDIPGYTTESRGDEMPGLTGTSFDWGNMIDFYNSSATNEQKTAVAKLFQYVGTGLKAAYDLSENGGTFVWDDMPEIVFKDYFGYGNGIQLIRRTNKIPESEWDNLICNELANGRPVLYSGQSSSGSGHSFVIDGYDGAGKYAINWGWGGYQDNYFALSALNPELGGAGAGTGGFNYDQTALVGISPNNVDIYSITVEETPVLSAVAICVADPSVNLGGNSINPADYIEYTGTRDGSGNIGLSLRFSYGYNLYYDYQFNIGFALMKDGAVINGYQNLANINFSGGNYSYSIYGTMGFGAGLANGDYQLKLAYKLASDSEWKLCVDADNHILNVRVTDTQIILKVGNVSPTPEVSQAELDELSALYAAQKTAINDKLSALTANETKMNTLASVLSDINTAINGLDSKISAIESKLNSEYLTAEQKQTYTIQLDELKAKRTTQITAYSSASGKLESLKSTSSTLKTALNSLLTQVNTGAAAVASITTKADLNTSKANVASIKTQQEGNNVAAETTKITELETVVAAISVTDILSSLSTLESTIDTAIATAKEAKEEEAKAKLEEDKKALTEACDEMTAKLNEKQNALGTNEKSGLAIETAIKEAQDAIGPVEKKIAAIKESLKSDMLTAVQKADFNSRLETLEKAKSDYVDNVKSLSNALALASKENDQLKFTLDEIDAQIKDLQSTINAITTTDALNKAKEDADKVDAQLSGISAADVEKQLLSVLDNLGKLSLDDTVKELAALEEEVEKAIASGQEEYEKQQAEKLAKAKEAFEAAIAALDETIQSQEANYEKRLNVLSTVKATLAELDDAISQMKAKYTEIERKLQEIIDKQSSTRSDDSEVIEELKKKLTELKKHIETLESQREVIPGQIDQLDQQMKSYAAVIEEAKAAKQKMQADLSSATTADEVEKLSASVSKEKSELASKGLYWYNTLVDNCNIVVEYVNGFADNVNIVDKETKALEKLVEEVVTAINQLIINKSEIVARYDMKGNPVDSTYKGVQIIKLKNGKTIKLYVK